MLVLEKRRIQFTGFVLGLIVLSITACGAKEGVKVYFNNIRTAHVEGVEAKLAAKHAKKQGETAEKIVTWKANRITGPITSCCWDFFEAVHYKGTGTMFGTYAGSFLGEQRLGRVGYLFRSTVGNWVGGRNGLMTYDVVHFLLQFSSG